MFALFQGLKDVYNDHIRYFVLAIVPLVITTISVHNFCFLLQFGKLILCEFYWQMKYLDLAMVSFKT